MNHPVTIAAIGELIRRAQQDDAFMRRLLEDTAGTLAGEGVDFPSWLRLRGFENGEPVFHFVVSAELSDADLDAVAGGGDKSGEAPRRPIISRIC